MSANSIPAQPAAVAAAPSAPPVSSAEIDASCRVPLLVLFGSAIVWLLVASVLGMIATLKFHQPSFLADCPWLTYGRVHPAHLNAAIYGFGIQAGLAALLWMICQLSRSRLLFAPGVVIGAKIWNLGVTLGVIGILYGENTGREWLEMPRYAALPLFCGYVMIGVAAMRTFNQRSEGPLYISLWFLIAAVFWFPWIYTTAEILLVAHPIRGALQAALDGWYVTNLTNIWFGFIGLATIFYFVPKLAQRPLHSHYLGILIFWTLALFGSWGGSVPGSPLPAWMAAMSTVAAVLCIVPVVAVFLNLRRTISGNYDKLLAGAAGKFILFGAAAFIVAGLTAALTALESVNVITNFTWANTAQTQLALYGFFAMTMFGVIYYIVPRLLGAEFNAKLAGLHFWLAAIGVLLTVVPLGFGGLSQGVAMNLHTTGFGEVMQGTLTFLRISTTGDLCVFLGHLLLALNLLGLLYRVGQPAVKEFWTQNTTKAAEVAS